MNQFRHSLRAVPLLPLVLALAACGGGGGSETTAAAALPTAQLGAVVSSETVLTPVGARASSAERGDLSAAAAIDHNDSTRWGSGFSDDEYLTLDFGKTETITRVRIEWENAHASALPAAGLRRLTQLDHDQERRQQQGGTEDITGLNGQGRYLRMQGVKRSAPVRLFDLRDPGFSGTPVTAPTEPPPTPPVSRSTRPSPAWPSSRSPPPRRRWKTAACRPPWRSTASPPPAGPAASRTAPGSSSTSAPRPPIGYMKLHWENAYGKEYALQVSDDGQTWTQVRYVANGKGGTEEFFNLGVNARYIRLQGVARATQYGYSLFEVEFKTPGSDNTLAAVRHLGADSSRPDGSRLAPLPAAAEPLETLQFTLADGTLVTRFGARGLARHGRERGEDWNEIGYGPNETVDPATGLPRRQGAGQLPDLRAAVLQEPHLGRGDHRQQPRGRRDQADADRQPVHHGRLPDGRRGVLPRLRPARRDRLRLDGARANWWIDNVADLQAGALPGQRQAGQRQRHQRRLHHPGQGLPGPRRTRRRRLPERHRRHRRARWSSGDVIEVSPSLFSTDEAMAAMGDNGGIRYYSSRMDLRGGRRPAAMVRRAAAPELGAAAGRDPVRRPRARCRTTTPTTRLFMFQQPHNNVGMQNMQRFVEGRRLVHTNFTTGDHNEPGNDRYAPAVGLQGQRFNQSACIACHVNNGRSPAPAAINQRLDTHGGARRARRRQRASSCRIRNMARRCR